MVQRVQRVDTTNSQLSRSIKTNKKKQEDGDLWEPTHGDNDLWGLGTRVQWYPILSTGVENKFFLLVQLLMMCMVH
jgi:hypothetical protein